MSQIVARVHRRAKLAAFEADETEVAFELLRDGGLASELEDRDSSGQLWKQIDPLGNVTEYVYDFLGRHASVIAPDPDDTGPQISPIIETAYDLLGRTISQTDPLGNVTTYQYDSSGRQWKTILPDPDDTGPLTASINETLYDDVGRVWKQIDPLGNVAEFAYDDLGRLATQTDSLSGETSYTYDDAGNRLTLTDPVGNVTTWVYDGLNRVVEEQNQLGDSRYFEYDANGAMTRRVDRRGWVRQFEYDNLSRNTAEIWYNNITDADADQNRQNTFSFTYDTAGQRLSVGDAFANYTYVYDHLGRATNIDNQIAGLTPVVSFSQQFDPLGRRTQLAAAIGATADFATDYLYDNLGQIDSIKQHDQTSGNAVAEKYIDFAFDSAGRPDFVTRYADLVGDDLVARSDYTFDNASRLTDLTHTKGTTTFADYDLTYDAANRITAFNFTSLDGDSGNADYTHDNTNQLTAADYDFQTDETYTYDANGNRTQGGYTTASNNQLLTDSTYTYAYDAEGNRTHRFIDADSSGTITPIDTQVTEYEWDHRNRLIKITNRATANGAATQIVEYAYDQNNRWVRKLLDTDGNGTINTNTIFIYDANQITLHFDHTSSGDATTTDTHRYLWGPTIDQLLADETITDGDPEDILWPLIDHLDTIRDLAQCDPLTNLTTIVNHRTYNAYGQILTETNPAITHLFAFTARPFDPDTNLQNNLHRWYDATTGRWMSEDPIGFAVLGTNLYRYVRNGPTNWVDPTGLRRDRSWRDRNSWRFWNLSLFDERGKELLGRWLNGTGEDMDVEEGRWGRYMRANDLLPPQIADELGRDALSRKASGPVNIKFRAIIENGYFTGYQMLHGTDGDFEIRGDARVTYDRYHDPYCNRRTVRYNVKFVWNDIIDPNPAYESDVIAADVLGYFYGPADYNVHIAWNSEPEIEISRGVITYTHGYPFDKAPIEPWHKNAVPQ